MTDKKVMQMALDALEQITPDWRTSIDKHQQLNNSIDALRTALAQPEPEPVAWRFYDGSTWCYVDHLTDLPQDKFEPLYTAPSKKEWVGLTDNEYETMAEQYVTNYYFDTFKYAKSIEANLKKRNT
jgi:hypothetical protein